MEQLKQTVRQFVEARGWEGQYALKKDLALSLTLEASELLECFQWKTSEEAVTANRAGILDELADVFIYAIQMADSMDVSIETIVKEKLIKNARKYPAKSI
ncbi:nucleotide pyrophosphohydrolase [Listeria cornellensis]|uniref:MazG nucleotide pyrophosphohydrolase n=1 Tax=Listeria cornellensis FSL F6-0969 TaxID=1265820 RepID=W7BID7_9LIST|nr:nucleotide pyrophosphohydrolase [Listeria cornellensis]EUJ25687.1 hypothetical protein PCORN_16330 [Listeria cornellensis FSL F6-0969]